jgi:small-conductance mechanosensitive channel
MLIRYVLFMVLIIPFLRVPGLPAEEAPAKSSPAPLGSADKPAVKIIPEPDLENPRATVLLGGVELFTVGGFKSISAQERAEKISERIQQFADDTSIPLSALEVKETEYYSNFVAGKKFLFTILDSDAQAEGLPRTVLVQGLMIKIPPILQEYRADRTPQKILWSWIHATLSTVVFLLLLWLFLRTVQKLLTWLNSKIAHINIRSLSFIRADWIIRILMLAGKALRMMGVIWLVILYLELVLSIFPWTRPLAYNLMSYLLVPLRALGNGFVGQLPNLLILVVLFYLTYLVNRFIRFVFREVEEGKAVIPGFYPDWARPTGNIVRVLVMIFAAIVAFPYIPGSSSPAFQGISIFLGVLLSLGSSSAVANLVAGIILTYMRAFKVGDFIQIGDSRGVVIASSLLVTRVRTIKMEDIVIPNSMILSAHVNNFSTPGKEQKLLLYSQVTIGYDTPWRQVEALLLEAAHKTRGILRDPAPFVLQTSLDDFYVTYQLNAATDNPNNMHFTYSELHANIQDTFNEYGVQIMSPNYMFDRSVKTYVPREQWYAPPAQPPASPGQNDPLKSGE